MEYTVQESTIVDKQPEIMFILCVVWQVFIETCRACSLLQQGELHCRAYRTRCPGSSLPETADKQQ